MFPQTYSEGCDKAGAKGPGPRKCKDWEGGEPYPSVDEFVETKSRGPARRGM